jgi:Ras family protein
MIKIVHEKILDFGGTEKVPCVVVGQKLDLDGERYVYSPKCHSTPAKQPNELLLPIMDIDADDSVA